MPRRFREELSKALQRLRDIRSKKPEKEDRPIKIKWPPESMKDCAEIPESTGDSECHVKIFHTGNYKAARIVAEYTEFMLAEAFANDYTFRIEAVEAPIDGSDLRRGDSWNKWSDRLQDDDIDAAKDANLLMFARHQSRIIGGGNSAVANCGSIVDDVEEGCIKLTGTSEGYADLITCLHEIGHCLGLHHEHGDIRVVDGAACNTVMKQKYGGNDQWTVLFSDKSRKHGIRIR